jgi:hypothetical protein
MEAQANAKTIETLLDYHAMRAEWHKGLCERMERADFNRKEPYDPTSPYSRETDRIYWEARLDTLREVATMLGMNPDAMYFPAMNPNVAQSSPSQTRRNTVETQINVKTIKTQLELLETAISEIKIWVTEHESNLNPDRHSLSREIHNLYDSARILFNDCR